MLRLTFLSKVWLAIETTIIFFVYPETKGPTLEELANCKYSLSNLLQPCFCANNCHSVRG